MQAELIVRLLTTRKPGLSSVQRVTCISDLDNWGELNLSPE